MNFLVLFPGLSQGMLGTPYLLILRIAHHCTTTWLSGEPRSLRGGPWAPVFYISQLPGTIPISIPLPCLRILPELSSSFWSLNASPWPLGPAPGLCSAPPLLPAQNAPRGKQNPTRLTLTSGTRGASYWEAILGCHSS